jgi:elongation factor G
VRQDPSLRLVWPEEDDSGQKVDPEAQTLLHGMGPLHLEISLRRLEDEQGVRARAGKMRVALKETVKEGTGMVELEEKWEGNVVGTQGPQQATVKIGLERLTDAELAEMTASGGGEHLAEWVNNDVSIEVGGASDPFFPLIPAISNALRSALTRGGPLLSYPLSHLRISITPLHADSSDEPSSPSLSSSSPDDIPAVLPPPAAIARAVASALKKAIKLSGPTILEPLVETRIWGVGPNDLGKVVADLISRGGQVQELGDEEMTSIGSTSTGGEGGEGGAYIPPAWVSPSASNTASSTERVQRRTILATMPLATMGDYAGKLRSLSGGGGVFESKEGGWGEVDLATVRKREERDGGE